VNIVAYLSKNLEYTNKNGKFLKNCFFFVDHTFPSSFIIYIIL